MNAGSLRWTLWAVVGVLGALLGLYLTLVVQNIRDAHRSARLQIRKEQIRPQLQAHLEAGEELRPWKNLRPVDLVALQELLLESHRTLPDGEKKHRLQRLAELVLTKSLRQALHAHRYVVRLHALYTLEELHLSSLRDDVIRRLKRARPLPPAERTQLLAVLANLQEEALLDVLADPTQGFLPDFVYQALLLKMEDRLFDRLINRLYTLPQPLRYCILDIIGNKGDLRYLHAMEALTYSRDREERIRALKAIIKLGYVQHSSSLVDKSEAESWQERLMAARAMGAVAKDEFINVLVKMLRDSSWWVRKESAHSLLLYPQGQEILRNIAEQDEDRYARDMALEWLEAKT